MVSLKKKSIIAEGVEHFLIVGSSPSRETVSLGGCLEEFEKIICLGSFFDLYAFTFGQVNVVAAFGFHFT